MSQSHRLSRVASDFSIERILADDCEKKSCLAYTGNEDFSSCGVKRENDKCSQVERFESNLRIDSCSRLEFIDEHPTNYRDSPLSINYSGISRAVSTIVSETFPPISENLKSLRTERNDLSWLHCTRYRPPKLPRKSSNGKTGKRRPGAHPRIPFTATQLQILEDKYRSTAYLSRRDVIQLSTSLRLPQSRVKIWFQNRRARDRRETAVSSSNIANLSNDTTSPLKTQNLTIEKFSSTSAV